MGPADIIADGGDRGAAAGVHLARVGAKVAGWLRAGSAPVQ
jgi:hypothetical protein